MAKKPIDQFIFRTKGAYFDDVVSRIRRAGRGSRIALATMYFTPVPEVCAIFDELGQAAERGATASLSIDAHTFLGNAHGFPGPLFFHRSVPAHMPKPYQKIWDILQTLRTQGVRCVITNQPGRPFTPQVTGRSHIKFAVIDEYAYIGGCNLDTAHKLDVMVGTNNSKIVDWVYDFSQRMIQAEGISFMHGADARITIDDETGLLIDAGKSRQSIILEQAFTLIDQAEKEVYITCQFLPNSTTMQHLIRAHERGLRVVVIYNHPSKHPFPNSLLFYMVHTRERLRTPAMLLSHQLDRKKPFLHAKLLITDKGAMIGSHNYVQSGVNFGTAEMTLYSKNLSFRRDALAVINAWLAPTSADSVK